MNQEELIQLLKKSESAKQELQSTLGNLASIANSIIKGWLTEESEELEQLSNLTRATLIIIIQQFNAKKQPEKVPKPFKKVVKWVERSPEAPVSRIILQAFIISNKQGQFNEKSIKDISKSGREASRFVRANQDKGCLFFSTETLNPAGESVSLSLYISVSELKRFFEGLKFSILSMDASAQDFNSHINTSLTELLKTKLKDKRLPIFSNSDYESMVDKLRDLNARN